MQIVSIIFFFAITLSILASFVFSVISVVRVYKALAIADESARRMSMKKIFLMFTVPVLVVFGLLILQGAFNLALGFFSRGAGY